MNINNSFIIWFTGLSGAGKTTLSKNLKLELLKNKIKKMDILYLDGDQIRSYSKEKLGFSKQDRDKNIEKISNIAKFYIQKIPIIIVSTISPYENTRNKIRQNFQNFIEIYVKCSLQECEKRDVKGLYSLARQGKITNFTGIDDPYEEPTNPELIIDTEKETIYQSTKKIIKYLIENNFII